MAFKVDVDKHDIADKFAIALKSERLFNDSVLQCMNAGLINKTSVSGQRYAMSSALIRNQQSFDLLTNSEKSTGKMKIVMSSGDHLSPLQEQQDSSMRIKEVAQQVSISRLLLEKQKSLFGNCQDNMKAYMITLTIPNCSKGRLNDVFKTHRQRVSKFVRSLKDGASRKNGLVLIGDGSYIGCLVSHELTVNESLISSKSVFSIYHPHTHIVLLTDDEIDIDETSDLLFSKWVDLNKKDYNLNRSAFDFRASYSKKKTQDDVLSSVVESIKYAVKPSTWNLFDDVKNDVYQRELFAEIYNSMRGFKKKMSFGILRQAKSFLNAFGSFESAISFSTLADFPDLVTQLVEINKTKNRFVSQHSRQLTSDEIIYYNRSLIENSLVSSDLTAEIYDYLSSAAFSDDVVTLFASVFCDIKFSDSVSELLSKIEEFENVARLENRFEKAYDLNLFASAIRQNISYVDTVVTKIDVARDLTSVEAEEQKNEKCYFSSDSGFLYRHDYVERFRDFLTVDSSSHVKYKRNFEKLFQDEYLKLYGSLGSDFSKLKNNFKIDTLRSQSHSIAEMFVKLDCSFEEYFNGIFEISASNAMPKSDACVA